MVAPKELSKKEVKEGKEPKEGKQRKKTQDFSEEYMSKDVIIRLSTGEEIRGRLADATKYWFKVIIRKPNASSELESIDVIYINKAYVAYVKPLS
jgi:small nuclear ribonucleoprotein (snRNP)-like protein